MNAFSSRRIVFMGTPDFAVASLEALLTADFDIAAVITSPDKAAGRGLQLQFSAVKQYALSKKIPILQPLSLKDPLFLTELASFKADLFIVVAFRMLPKEVWNMPSLGTFNLHASLLPRFRGAAPIQHAIISGETETGVTTFLLDEKMDTGAILYTEKTPISEMDNAGSLHDRLMLMGANLVVKTANDLFFNAIKAYPQENFSKENLPLAPKIFKKDCVINWNKKSDEVLRLIRGLSPYPTAISYLCTTRHPEGILCKIFEAEKTNFSALDEIAGKLYSDGHSCIYIACAQGEFIQINSLQLAGKKRLNTKDFLKGFYFSKEDSPHFIDITNISS